MGQYDPKKKQIVIQGDFLLKPLKMNHTSESGMLSKSSPICGTILVPASEIPNSEHKLFKSFYHGEASIFEPCKILEANESEPTVLVIREEGSNS